MLSWVGSWEICDTGCLYATYETGKGARKTERRLEGRPVVSLIRFGFLFYALCFFLLFRHPSDASKSDVRVRTAAVKR